MNISTIQFDTLSRNDLILIAALKDALIFFILQIQTFTRYHVSFIQVKKMHAFSLEFSIDISAKYRFGYFYLARSYDDQLIYNFILFYYNMLKIVRLFLENLMSELVHFIERKILTEIRKDLNQKFSYDLRSDG